MIRICARFHRRGHNLVVKTAELIRKEYGIREGLNVHLKKKIPVAAGMAGEARMPQRFLWG